MARTLKSTALLVVAPAAGAITPLIALPALTASGGAQAWAAVAIGQSVGLASATVVELGWGLTGPQATARRTPASRKRLLALSLRARLILLGPIAILAAVVSAALSPNHPLLSALSAGGGVATGMTLVWFFVGSNRPVMVLATDALPRLLMSALSAWLMLRGAGPLAYPAVGLLGGCGAALIAGVLVGQPDWRQTKWRLGRILRIIWGQRQAIAGRSVSAIYIALPTALLSVVSPGSVAVFAAVDRLQRMGLSVLTAVPSAMQAQVGVAPLADRERVAKTAAYWNTCVGVVAGGVCAVAVGPTSQIVFAGTVDVPPVVAALSGLVVFLVVTSRAVGGLVLVAKRRIGTITASAVAGAAVGVPAIMIAGHNLGATGAFIGLVAAEGTVLMTQLWGAGRTR